MSVKINNPEQFARLFGCVSQHAPHMLPLLRAASVGALALISPDRHASLHAQRMMWSKPVCVLIGDDDGAFTDRKSVV